MDRRRYMGIAWEVWYRRVQGMGDRGKPESPSLDLLAFHRLRFGMRQRMEWSRDSSRFPYSQQSFSSFSDAEMHYCNKRVGSQPSPSRLRRCQELDIVFWPNHNYFSTSLSWISSTCLICDCLDLGGVLLHEPCLQIEVRGGESVYVILGVV
jgi:hypothetical protein